MKAVQCADCANFEPAAINPTAAAGKCATGANAESTSAIKSNRKGLICWPHAQRYCEAHTKYQRYEISKADWVHANPQASPADYERAIRSIADREGV
jgi:hypothetical protein